MMCSCNHATEPQFEEEHPETLHSIPYLKSLAHGESTPLHNEIAIEGIVTSDDTYGEFSRELVLEDEHGGITLQLAGTQLYRRYPRGTQLRVRCNGLVLYAYGDRIALGAPYNNYGSTHLSEKQAEQHLQPLGTNALMPRRVRIGTLTTHDINRYVRLDEVRFLEEGFWCEFDAAGDTYLTTVRTIEDRDGARLQIRTLGSADYADEPLPTGRGSLCGIVDIFDGALVLRVVGCEFQF